MLSPYNKNKNKNEAKRGGSPPRAARVAMQPAKPANSEAVSSYGAHPSAVTLSAETDKSETNAPPSRRCVVVVL